MYEFVHSMNSSTKNSPHTSTYSFLVSPHFHYYFPFQFTSPDSIYTIDIPPCIRKLHNHLLYILSLKYYFFLPFLFFCEIRKMCPNQKLLAIHKSKFQESIFFFNFHDPTQCTYFLFTQKLTFCLPPNYRNILFVYLVTPLLFCSITDVSC